MQKGRALNLQESSALVLALASARSAAYTCAINLRDKSTEMENAGESGYVVLDNEADQHEGYADIYDAMIEFICEGRLVIREREGEQ